VSRLRQFGRFWYDFIVGDDWRIAASVVLLVLATAVAAHRWDLWPLLPIGVTLTLASSLQRAATTASEQESAPGDD
jgi:hypothetical protein